MTMDRYDSGPGWRQPVYTVLVQSFPAHGIARKGYLGALYALRANILPRAFIRSEETTAFQNAIEWAIRTLETEETERNGG